MITELKQTNLIAVDVAPDASNFEILNSENYLDKNNIPKGAKGDLCYLTEQNVWHIGNVILPDGKFKILGTVIKDKIEFDVEPYVDKLNGGSYADYEHGGNALKIRNLNKEESFYSLLAANGLYFENHIPDTKGLNPKMVKNFATMYQQWKSIEDKIVKRLLIIEKI